jgi:hypothetical protein
MYIINPFVNVVDLAITFQEIPVFIGRT